MKYLSLFSGIGGFELGIQQAYEDNNRQKTDNEGGSAEVLLGRDVSNLERINVERPIPSCIGYSEIDKYAIQIYEKNFKGHKNYGDITKIEAGTLPDLDLIVGGFPCQSFSIAGKRGGFQDTRGTLFFDICRIIKAKRPKYLLLENVKGLLSHDGGRTFKTIITTLAELGYCVEWQVLNSKNFGVPQNRERVFIVGYLGNKTGQTVFPIREADGTVDEGSKPKHPKGEVASTIRSRYGNGSGSHLISAIPVLTPDRAKKRQNGRRFKEPGDPAFTVNTQDRHRVYLENAIRRLTPKECERLQGFPDDWTAGISDTQRYKTLGNAVTVNVIREIMGRLLKNEGSDIINPRKQQDHASNT